MPDVMSAAMSDRSVPIVPTDPLELSETLLHTEKMASLGELVTGVAHEINNPVNFIHGNLGYADRYMQDLLKLVSLYRQILPETSPETPIEISQQIDQMDLDFVLEDFPKIQASMQLGASRIYDIVQSLRTFSHSDDSQPQTLDLHQSIESTLVILHNRLKGTGNRPAITLEKNFSEISPIECYAGRINQVMMNLVSNAIDAIETQLSNALKSEQLTDWIPRITIDTAQPEPGWISVTVRDNGCGITPQVKTQMFNPFFTTKTVNRGTGLGLAICQKIIVQDHNGRLDCESSLESGTAFTLRLPIAPDLTDSLNPDLPPLAWGDQ
jgi:two-component system, NtrC family, sensor kinase